MKAAYKVKAVLQIETYKKINKQMHTLEILDKASMALSVYNIINPIAFHVNNAIRQSGQIDERY